MNASSPRSYTCRMRTTPYLLEWNLTESIDCVAQAVVTNDTDNLWISCTTYIAKGKFIFDEKEPKDPIGIELDYFNKDPLNNSNLIGYGHIGDGDYVPLDDGEGEIWFGLEDKENPRVLPGAIARYNANTLEFIDIHPHPTVNTMAFVAYHQSQRVAYTMNWTDNHGELLVFDAINYQWTNTTALISGLSTKEFLYIQGADMAGDTLYLMGDDYRSTLFELQMKSSKEGTCKSIQLGLGHEREGISIYDTRWRNPRCQILTMNNQWYTWEDNHYAGITCISLGKSPSKKYYLRFEAIGAGVMVGIALFSLLIYNLCRAAKMWLNTSYESVPKDPVPTSDFADIH